MTFFEMTAPLICKEGEACWTPQGFRAVIEGQQTCLVDNSIMDKMGWMLDKAEGADALAILRFAFPGGGQPDYPSLPPMAAVSLASSGQLALSLIVCGLIGWGLTYLVGKAEEVKGKESGWP